MKKLHNLNMFVIFLLLSSVSFNSKSMYYQTEEKDTLQSPWGQVWRKSWQQQATELEAINRNLKLQKSEMEDERNLMEKLCYDMRKRNEKK